MSSWKSCALGVEPAAELAFLAPCELRDALRVVRLALDERERLQHGVVDAGGDLCALLRADASRALCVALLRGAPEPRPDDEQETAGERSRGEQRAARADVAAARQQRAPRRATRSAVPTSRCCLRQRKNTPAAASAAATWTKAGSPSPFSAAMVARSRSASPSAVRVPLVRAARLLPA